MVAQDVRPDGDERQRQAQLFSQRLEEMNEFLTVMNGLFNALVDMGPEGMQTISMMLDAARSGRAASVLAGQTA